MPWQELSLKYEEVLLDAGELQARLWRADGFNNELQQTIKRERRERSEREKRIAELEKKIQVTCDPTPEQELLRPQSYKID